MVQHARVVVGATSYYHTMVPSINYSTAAAAVLLAVSCGA